MFRLKVHIAFKNSQCRNEQAGRSDRPKPIKTKMKYRTVLTLTFILILGLGSNVGAAGPGAELSNSYAECSIPTFEAGKAITVSGSAGVITSADFNNDGKKDFVIAKGVNPNLVWPSISGIRTADSQRLPV